MCRRSGTKFKFVKKKKMLFFYFKQLKFEQLIPFFTKQSTARIAIARHVEQIIILLTSARIWLIRLKKLIRAVSYICSSAQMVLSSQDFGVEQFFRADEFRADEFRAVDPSPYIITNFSKK